MVFYKIVIGPLFLYQWSMITCLHYTSFIQHDNLVGIFYGAEPVGYHHDCSSLIELIQILDYGAFVLGIQGIGGFVQKDI